MKKTFTLMLLCLIIFKANCQEIIDGKKLGLVSYITFVKEISEFKMTSLINDKNYITMPEAAQKFNSDYNLLKLTVDQLINQLSADMVKSNNLKLYKKLDSYLQNQKELPKKYNKYKLLLNQIDDQLTTLLIRKYTGGALAGPGLDIITGVVTEAREIITSARDFREKKVQSINALIKDLKLVKLSELLKPKDKDTKD